MSNTSITAVRPVSPNSQLRLTSRGRLVFTMFFLALLAAGMVFVGGRAAASLDSGNPPQVRYVKVTTGDTLYSIAGGYADPGKVRDLVREIEELNSMPNVTIHPGQRLAIPVG